MDAASSAGWAFSVRLRSSSGPSQARRVIGSPSAASAAANTAAAAGEDSARARPMPTNWLPWPGNTSANLAHLAQRSRSGFARPPDRCTLAGIGGRSYARSGEDRPVTDIDEAHRPSAPRRRARRGPPDQGLRPGRRPGPPRGPRPRAPPRRLEPDDRPHASRPTCRRRSSPPGRGSRTSARSPSASRWAARCGASSWSASRTSSASSTSASRSWPRCTCSPRASTTTVADLAEAIGRSPSATSRLVDGLVKRRLVERRREDDDGRHRTVWLTQRGQAVLRMVDRARAEQFLSAVRPMPRGERALIAMGVAALATHAISRRGRLVRGGS